MTLAALLPEFAPLPFYAQLMYAFVAGSGLFCLAVVAGGALRICWRGQTGQPEGLPPPPARFPRAIDQVYTALFLLFILWGALSHILPDEEGDMGLGKNFGWRHLLLGVAAQIGVYLPMLVRYVLVHPGQRPTQPWWHYLTQPLLFLTMIYMAVGSLELSGFSEWLVRATGCPEHQGLVLLFSRGEPLQRLYIIICAVLIAPVAEEFCFRGFLYTSLRRWGGCVAATLASALLFGAIHSSLAQLLPLTVFGIVQCIAYEKSRSLWLPIAIHALFNTISLVATALMQP